MELEGERFGAQESVSKSFQVQMSGQLAREAWKYFYSPKGNLLVGVLEIAAVRKPRPGHVRARGRTCPVKASRNQSKSRICLVYLGVLVSG
jgi:hypothetical protein